MRSDPPWHGKTLACGMEFGVSPYSEPRRQAIDLYGQPTPLQAGMTVDAYVLQETRAIYEWMLEPLLSVHSVSMSSGAVDAH